MRKILLFLVLLGVLFSLEIEWEIDKLPDYINKPWEGYWVNTYYKNNILSTEIHPSLTELKLDTCSVPDEKVMQKINYAKQQYAIASMKKQQCEQYFSFIDGNFGFTNNLLNALYDGAKNAYDKAVTSNDTIEQATAMACMLAINGVGGMFPFLWSLCGAYVASDMLGSYDACKNYGTYWKSTMTSSAEALELSANAANEKYKILKEGYENLTWAGMCNENYTWDGKDVCNGISQELVEAKAGSSSALGGHEGLMGRIKGYSEAMKSTGLINTSNYSLIMDALWKVAIPYTENETKECSNAMKNALDEYAILKTDTENEKSTAENWLEKCSGEKLTDLNFALIGGEFVIGGTGGIKNDCEAAERYAENAEKACKLSDAVYAEKGEDWLLRAFQYEEGCYENFDSAAGYAEQAYKNAETTIASLRESASQAIAGAEGKADPEILQEAKNEFNAGESASILGERALHYKKAWELANAAIAAFVPANVTNPETERQFNILKAEVEGMLSKAQADGIDITTERSLYEYYISLGPTKEAIDGLKSVMDAILNKALIAYGDLEYLREEIYEAIESTNGAFDYLLPELRALEAGYIKNGKIDFAAALGYLATMKQGYLDILDEMETQKEKGYSGSIIWTYSKDFEPAKLDRESRVVMYIYATNPNAFKVAGGEKVFDFPFEVMQSEVSGEIIGVVSDGETLTLYPKDFAPFESRSFVVGTSSIIASTSSQDVYAFGYDGKADVIDGRFVEFLGPSQGLYVPDEWESVKVDGYEYTPSSSFINKKFSAGFYEITGAYTVIDAYDWEEKNHNSITVGTTTTISYDIVIYSEMHIDEMKFIVDGTDVDAYASGGASVKTVGQEVTVYDVDKGETTLHIKYEISNANEYINQKIEELNNEIDGDKCPDAEQALNDAVLAFQRGDINTAMEKLKEAEALWEKYLRGAEKAQAEYDKYLAYVNEQLEQINKALARADALGLSGGFVDSLKERKTSIESFIAGLENLDAQEKAIKVKEFDRNWLEKEANKFLKDAFSEVGGIKADYYKLGASNPEVEGYFNEFEANHKKARASERDYTPHIDAYASLLKIKSAFEGMVASKSTNLAKVLSEFNQLKEEISEYIVMYTNEYNDAKKTPYESLFQFLPKYYSDKLSGIEKEVQKTDKPDEIAKRVERLKKMKDELEGKFSIFKNSAEEMLRIVEIEFTKAKPNLDGKLRESIESSIEVIKQNIANKKYVSAMNTANNILVTLGRMQKSGIDFILWFGVLLLIIASIFYYLRSGGKFNFGGFGGLGKGGLFKEEKGEAKPLKKLERVK